MKMKKVLGRVFVLIGVTACLLFGLYIAPEQSNLRTLGLFLYFYICLEIAFQIAISRRKEKEAKLRDKQKDDVQNK